jgi:hypothetical protein
MVRQLANNLVEALRNQPYALALVVINIAFVIGMGFMLQQIAHSAERRDALLASVAQRCLEK